MVICNIWTINCRNSAFAVALCPLSTFPNQSVPFPGCALPVLLTLSRIIHAVLYATFWHGCEKEPIISF